MSIRYSDETKADALARIEAGEKPSAVARDTGVSPSTLHRWGKAAAWGAERNAAHPAHSRVSETPLDTSWHDVFIATLADTANATAAARAAGVGRRTAYDHREADPEFARRWDEAEAIGDDAVIAEVRRRGIEGVDEPVFYQGEECGKIRRYSDAMLSILARHAHGGKYREGVVGARAKIDAGTGGLTLEVYVTDKEPE